MKTKFAFLFFLAVQICKIYTQTFTCTTPFITSDWTCLGPFEYPTDNQMGRVVSLWVNPENTDHILAGTRASSLWETTDGGDHWQNILSYQFPATGVWSIAAYADGSGYNYYLSTMFNGSDRTIHSLGMMYYDYSEDEWVQVSDFPDYSGTAYDFKLEGVIDNELKNRKFFVRPGTSELWVGNSRNFFRWDMSTNTWIDDVYPGSYPVVNLDDDGDASAELHQVNEVDFAPWDNTMAILSPASAEDGDLLFTANADDVDPDWTSMYIPFTGLFTVDEPAGDTYRMTCSASIPQYSDAYVFANYLIIRSDGSTEQYNRLFKYLLPVPGGSAYPTLVNYWDVTNDFITYTDYDLAENLLVFPDHPEQFIIGNNTTALFKGTIPLSGSSITMGYVSVQNGSSASLTHTDIRDIAFINNSMGEADLLFIATDGGVSKTSDIYGLIPDSNNDDISKWQNINGYGFTITEFNGFNNSELEGHQTWAAAPDGNSFLYSNLLTDDEAFFTNYPGGDGYDVAISDEDFPKAIFNSNSNGTKSPSFFSDHDIDNLSLLPSSNPTVPKSKKSSCTDCEVCPWNCLESNFSLKPFNFEMDNDGEYLWTGTSDLFRNADPFTTPTDGDWIAMSKTYITLADPDVDDLANLDVITYNPITAYEKVDDFPLIGETRMYYSTKEIKHDYVYTNPDDVDVFEEIKLVKATYNTTTIPPTLFAINITPSVDEDAGTGTYNQIDYSFITGMAIDKTNPQEIWVCFGSNSLGGLNRILDYTLGENHNAKKGRVYYSPDGGDTWQNKSDGLPNYPVLNLCYWEGSDDILFAGTDVGVYVWNKTEDQWECFDTGDQMPYASVNDLEINYCTMSLRASTFGFGIWETPLPVLTSAQQKPIIINTDITWTQDMDAKTDIIIEYPGSLTIDDCEIRMPENGKITVKQGARLDVKDNARITNHCAYWNGIFVEGNNNKNHPAASLATSGIYPSVSDDHAVVYVSNGSIISNSLNCIYTANSGSRRGGIVIGDNATFKNNAVSINLGKFDRPDASGNYDTDDDNICSFSNCAFTVDIDNLSPQTTTDHHVKLNDVDGVVFSGCTFEGIIDIEGVDDEGISVSEGIFNTNATYSVYSTFADCVLQDLSSFSGFFRAIEAANTANPLLDIVITYTTFTNNTRGILLSGVNHSEILGNTFEIPDHATDNCYGIYLESCKDYHVEENTFTGYGSIISGTPYNAGTYVANNSNSSTEIYRNTYHNLETGIRCQGNNSNLKLQCNTFNEPMDKFQIYVTSGTLGEQGVNYTGPSLPGRSKSPAGNKFSGEACSSTLKYIRNLSGVNFTYNHHNTPAYDPSASACWASDVTFTNTTWVYDYEGYESCPNTIGPCVPGGGRVTMSEEAADTTGASMLANATEMQTEIETQNAKIDGGNTNELVSEIVSGSNETELYNTLKDASPYLSDDVMSTLLETEYALTTYIVLDVLDDNAPLQDSLGNEIVASEYEIPAAVADALTDDTVIVSGAIQIEQSARQALENYVEAVHAEKIYYLEKGITYYLKEGKTDSAFVAAEADNTDANWNLQKEAEIHITSGNLTQAQETVNNITASLEELADYKALQTVHITMQNADISIDSAVAQNAEALQTIAGKYTVSGVAAGNALKLQEGQHEVYAEIFDEDIEDEEEYKLNNYGSFVNSSFILYPNPAEDIVYVQMNEAAASCCNHLYIYDITGKTVFQQRLEAGFAVTWINTSGFNKGIYFVQLVSDAAKSDAQKLVIE